MKGIRYLSCLIKEPERKAGQRPAHLLLGLGGVSGKVTLMFEGYIKKSRNFRRGRIYHMVQA